MKSRGVYLKLRWSKYENEIPVEKYGLEIRNCYSTSKYTYCYRLLPVYVPKDYRNSIDRLFIYSDKYSYILKADVSLMRQPDKTEHDDHEYLGQGVWPKQSFPNLTDLIIGKFWIKIYNFYLTLIFSSLLNRGNQRS